MNKTLMTIRQTFTDPITNIIDWTSVRLAALLVVSSIGAIICFTNAIFLIQQ